MKGGAREGAGRPKGKVSQVQKELREKAALKVDDAIAALVEIFENEEQPASARVSAATALLDRGAGKPQSFISGDLDLSGMDGAESINAVLGAVTGGAVSLEEAERLTKLIATKSQIVDLAEIAARLDKLERTKDEHK